MSKGLETPAGTQVRVLWVRVEVRMFGPMPNPYPQCGWWVTHMVLQRVESWNLYMNTQSWQIWQLVFCSTTTIHGNHSLPLLHHHQQSRLTTIVWLPQWPLCTPTPTTAWQHYITRQTNDNKGWPQPGTLMDVPHHPDGDPCCHHWPHYSKWAAYLPNPSPFFTQEAGVAITNVATNNRQVTTQHINRRATLFRGWHMSSLLSSPTSTLPGQVTWPNTCKKQSHLSTLGILS